TELTKELTSNLTKELEARKIQYEYYRDELLKNSFEFTNFKLGNIAKFKYGYTDKAKDAGNVRFIRITDITEEGKLNPSNPKYIELSEENKEYLVNKGDLLMARTGATYGKTLYVETDKPAIYDSFLIKIILDNDLILNRYYWHFSKSTIFWEQAEKLATKGDQLQFNTNVLQNIKIPIPKIEIQKKIVDVLDNFELICSDLNIGLPAEIEARQKQYEFYRDALLEYAYTGEIIHTERETGRQAIIRLIQYVFGSVKVKLSDIANIQRGGNFAKKDFISEGIPCIHYGQIYTKYGIQIDKTISYISKETSDKAKMANKDDIIMAVTSENLEDVCKCLVWLGDDDVAVGGHTAIIKTSQNSKYLAYYLHTSMFFSQKRRLAHGTKVLEVTPNKLKDIEIPLPKLEQQEKIVTILDNFNNLINDISEGIPAEIEARQKQYEYYRDKLLSFK
ncbi:MAG: restriction endonuclease subunit S, partial [Anaerococcus sp.]